MFVISYKSVIISIIAVRLMCQGLDVLVLTTYIWFSLFLYYLYRITIMPSHHKLTACGWITDFDLYYIIAVLGATIKAQKPSRTPKQMNLHLLQLPHQVLQYL